jgi:hypothetical protein
MRLEFQRQGTSDISRDINYGGITTGMLQGQSLQTSSIPSCNSIFRRPPILLNLTAFASVISGA